MKKIIQLIAGVSLVLTVSGVFADYTIVRDNSNVPYYASKLGDVSCKVALDGQPTPDACEPADFSDTDIHYNNDSSTLSFSSKTDSVEHIDIPVNGTSNRYCFKIDADGKSILQNGTSYCADKSNSSALMTVQASKLSSGENPDITMNMSASIVDYVQMAAVNALQLPLIGALSAPASQGGFQQASASGNVITAEVTIDNAVFSKK